MFFNLVLNILLFIWLYKKDKEFLICYFVVKNLGLFIYIIGYRKLLYNFIWDENFDVFI